jgi:glycerophosphodiester phosphodiesterase
MKFRNKFSRHIVAPWESYYIPYSELKASLKAVSNTSQQPSSEFYSRFSNSILAATAFSLQHLAALRQKNDQMEGQWNDSSGDHENDMSSACRAVRDVLLQFLGYCRVNHEAINRIYAKITSSTPSPSHEVKNHLSILDGNLAEYREAYTRCVESLDSHLMRMSAHTNEMVSDHYYDAVVAAMYGAAGFTPLQAAVFSGQFQMVESLLSSPDEHDTLVHYDLLDMALRREDDALVQLLVSRSIGLRHKSSSGETCLHLAAQLGREDYVHLLLQSLGSELVDIAELARQWTALFVASAEGHFSIVKLLLDAGADFSRTDYLGWTAQEHAAFKGHIPVAGLFSTPHSTADTSWSNPLFTVREKPLQFEISRGLSHVVLNLGGLQDRKQSKSATLDLPSLHGHGLVLRISTSKSGTSFERMIPLLDDPVDDTFVFPVEDPAETMVVFSIHKINPRQDELIGSGVAPLFAQAASLGPKHGTLVREHTVSILAKDTLKVLGSVTFSFLVAKPYQPIGCPLPDHVASFEPPGSAQLVGHRGTLSTSIHASLILTLNQDWA